MHIKRYVFIYVYANLCIYVFIYLICFCFVWVVLKEASVAGNNASSEQQKTI